MSARHTVGTLSSSGRILSVQLDTQVIVCREFALSSPRNFWTRHHRRSSAISVTRPEPKGHQLLKVAEMLRRGMSDGSVTHVHSSRPQYPKFRTLTLTRPSSVLPSNAAIIT